jgi:Zn-dependent peptidase ImmA (M78 family)
MISSHQQTYFRGPTSDKAISLGSRVAPREAEANKFAAAFLAPSHLAKPTMTAEHISELFDINISAAALRREALARMDRRARNILRPLPPGVEEYLSKNKGKKQTGEDPSDE